MQPLDFSLHQSYTFYVRASAIDGGAFGWFGPYTLHIGCTPATVSFTDNAAFITSQFRYVGEALFNAYEFKLPSSTRSWCTNIRNEIVQADGTAWSGT